MTRYLAVFTLLAASMLYGQTLDWKQKSKLSKLITDFRLERDVGKKKGIAEEILKMGEPAAVEFKKALLKQQEPILNAYLKELERVAAAAYKKAHPRVDRTKVSNARSVLAKLRAKGADALKKEEIVAKGDPALKTLRDELLINVDAVLSGNARLAGKKDAMKIYRACLKACDQIIGRSKAQAKPKTRRGRSRRGGAIAPPSTPSTAEQALARKELLAVFVATAAGKFSRLLKQNETMSSEISGREADGILDLNIMRIIMGLNPLMVDVALCEAARDHSNDMATKGFFSHTSPVAGKKKFTDRAKRFGTRAGGENIAMGQRTPKQANQGWFHSPGHHVNMFRTKLTAVGLGEIRNHWTQLLR